MSCGHCNTDVRWGSTVCSGCHAEVVYKRKFLTNIKFNILNAVIFLVVGLITMSLVEDNKFGPVIVLAAIGIAMFIGSLFCCQKDTAVFKR